MCMIFILRETVREWACWYFNVILFIFMIVIYSLTCLNQISLESTLVVRLDRCSIYTGKITIDFLQWDFNI